MISKICEGKNVEAAITKGLTELQVNREDVEIKIISTGGLFRKAKVEIVVDSEIEEKLNAHRRKLEALMQEDKLEQKENEVAAVVEENAVVEQTTQNEETKILNVNNDFTEQNCTTKTSFTNGIEKGYQFLLELLKKMDINCSITVEQKNDGVYFNVVSDKVGALIGKRGEGLNAVQYLTNIVAGKNDRNVERIFINCGDYKERREQSLIMLARRMAVKVAKTGHRIELEPMNAYERKIVHTALQKDPIVTTYSVGEEPRRRLIIDLKKDEEKNG